MGISLLQKQIGDMSRGRLVLSEWDIKHHKNIDIWLTKYISLKVQEDERITNIHILQQSAKPSEARIVFRLIREQ